MANTFVKFRVWEYNTYIIDLVIYECVSVNINTETMANVRFENVERLDIIGIFYECGLMPIKLQRYI